MICNPRGQSLLLAVMLGLLLILCVPVLVFLAHINSARQATSQKNDEAESVAEEGIAYAAKLLSQSQGNWNNDYLKNLVPLGGCPNTFTSPPTLIDSPSGGKFEVLCNHPNPLPTNLADLQPYEVNVEAVAFKQDGNSDIPVRAMQAYLSQRTLGTRVTTGESAAAALELMTTPTISGTLAVHWGPIVNFDYATWTLTNPMNQAAAGTATFTGFPRKFSQGLITPRTPASATDCGDNSIITTDHKEYWACASQSVAPTVDSANYLVSAQAETGFPPATSGALPNSGSGHFVAAVPNTAVTFNGYTFPAGAIIYVDGNATLGNITFTGNLSNQKDMVVFISTGLVTLAAPGAGSAGNVPVPRTAPLEYAYWPHSGPQWPCSAQVGGACAAATALAGSAGGPNVHFYGFLYAANGLSVTSSWNLDGAVLVGMLTSAGSSGPLTVNPGASLTLLYNDQVNRAILVTPVDNSLAIDLATDMMKDIPLP